MNLLKKTAIHRFFSAFTILFLVVSNNATYASSFSFSGTTTSITPDKSCKEKPTNGEITLVFDGDPESAINGWLYGKATSAAEFRRISPSLFEVTYALTRYHKLPPSYMELNASRDGYNAIVEDHIPEDKDIQEISCFYEKLEVNLMPLINQKNDLIEIGKELFAADLLIIEAGDFMWVQNDYKAAIALGQKALPIYERISGKWGKESLNAASIITFALMYQERFDEALVMMLPFQNALPDNADIKELIKIINSSKKK